MCGIAGIVSRRLGVNVLPTLLEIAPNLLDRGYDGCGVGYIGFDKIHTSKVLGRNIGQISDSLSKASAHVAFWHNRWKTHGDEVIENTHPFVSSDGMAAIVHNGTIDNYQELRTYAEQRGFIHKGTTDSEVLANLVALELLCFAPTFAEAVAHVVNRLEGAFAIVAISRVFPDEMVVACKGMTVVVGISEEGDLFLSSDDKAIAPHVSQLLSLDDTKGEIAVLQRDGISIVGVSEQDMLARMRQPVIDTAESGRGNHKSRMAFEILTQHEGLLRTVDRRSDIEDAARILERGEAIYIIGCGTSLHAGGVGADLLESLAGKACVMPRDASEFAHTKPPIHSRMAAIFPSQSGQTADSRRALALVDSVGMPTVGLTNVPDSAIARGVTINLDLRVGREKAVASTRAFTGQATVFAMLALALGRLTGLGDELQRLEVQRYIEHLPKFVERTYACSDQMKQIALSLMSAERTIFIGRHYLQHLAGEAALKTSEICRKDSYGYSSDAFKHGPFALIRPGIPIFCLVPDDKVQRDLIVNNMEEIRARHGRLIVLCSNPDERIRALATDLVELPYVPDALKPAVWAPAVHLFALHYSVCLGMDPDFPENLAKVVTV